MEENRKLKLDIFGSIEQLISVFKDFETKRKNYKLFFRGKSFDFETFCQYYPDDDAFNIDWTASARYDKLLVKQYKEEEKLTVIFFIDVGDNMVLGSGEKIKCECAAEIALSLAFLAIMRGHRIGFVLFNDKVKLFHPPKGGKRAFFSFADILTDGNNYGGGSNLNQVLDIVGSFPHYHGGVAVLISDFIRFDESIKNKLSLLSLSFETFSIIIRDSIDKELPNVAGEFVIEDIQDGRQIVFDPRLAKRRYKNSMRDQEYMVKKIFNSAGIDSVEVMPNEQFILKVGQFMHERIKLKDFKK
ncbi:MAG: DUF58 domain-containing protein [Nanoarchaeota archaeon]|nr:DUF58 domain-containing protein [Nanoarchaeota archaeon]